METPIGCRVLWGSRESGAVDPYNNLSTIPFYTLIMVLTLNPKPNTSRAIKVVGSFSISEGRLAN